MSHPASLGVERPTSPAAGRTAAVGRWGPARAVPTLVAAPVRLYSCESMGQVELLMADLSQGEPGDLLGTIAVEHLATGGKRLRARLALAALEAVGAPRSRGVGWAAACELLHNATLIHDDVQDGDRTRRGKPTVWARHGEAQAINAGDLLLMLPFLALERVDADAGVRARLVRLLAECAAWVARGQAAELAVDPAEPLDWPQYRQVVARKTGALFQLPVEGAALLAGRSPAAAREVGLEFQRLGVLFQLQDDLLDLYGDKGREQPGSDLREGKVTALIIEYLRRVPEDHFWLAGLLATPRAEVDEAEVRMAIRRFRAKGAHRAVLARIVDEAEAVADSPALAGEPALLGLALELTAEILKPIDHLFTHDADPEADSDVRLDGLAPAGEVA
jgi:geranylgeranyl diphosphate synthase, type I